MIQSKVSVQGYTLVAGIDYTETFSLVAMDVTIEL